MRSAPTAPKHNHTVGYCPRCRHEVGFACARSDGEWVCQKCLRYRKQDMPVAKANSTIPSPAKPELVAATR